MAAMTPMTPTVRFPLVLASLAALLAAAPVASGCGGQGSSADGAGSPPGADASDDGAGTAADGGLAGDDAASDPGTPPSSDSGLSTDGAADADAAPSPPPIEFAPYFPTWVWGGSGYAITGLADLHARSGLTDVTIAFVLSGGGCKADGTIAQNLQDVKAFLAAGGHVKASFGGADGTYVESQCSDAASLAKAIEDFVDATGIADLDFDIEQDPVLTDAVDAMRGQALAMVQAARPAVQVAFTLAALPHASGSPGGLTSQGLAVVSHALSAGVTIAHVNLMTMDYGDSYGGQPLAPVAIGSLTDANAQLVGLVPGLTPAQAWRMLGVIPMIGKNDDAEVFSLADASDVASFAIQKRLGLVSFWSIDRDQVCPSGADYNTCSTVDAKDFDFANAFLTVTTH